MEWMTAKKTANGEISALEYAMTLESFDSVRGAAGIIATARGKEW